MAERIMDVVGKQRKENRTIPNQIYITNIYFGLKII